MALFGRSLYNFLFETKPGFSGNTPEIDKTIDARGQSDETKATGIR